MRANTQNVQGEQETRGMGEGRKQTVGNRDMRTVEGRGMGRGTRGKQDGHHRDFQDLTRQGTFGKEGMEFEGGGFGVD